MCPLCQAEYDDPADRRFHAQPNACPTCGPRLSWRDRDGEGEPVRGATALECAAVAVASGQIVAMKGIGGYHLVVDATNEDAVAELRRRKARDHKPFAVMVATLAAANQLCDLNAAATFIESIRCYSLPPRSRCKAVGRDSADRKSVV